MLVNRSDQPVKVYWLNFQGQRVLYNLSLSPGERQVQKTFVGHNWLITTMSGQCVEIFRTEPPPADDRAAADDRSLITAPPEIPLEEQPPPPEDNLVWTPGYWAWNQDAGNYYWIPGIWVAAPIVGYLWTPGYWFLHGGIFAWQAGFWGPHVGFYGGINYGHGYLGRGFVGGAWRDGRMLYNGAVTNVGNLKSSVIYNQPAGVTPSMARVSYNGEGGARAQPNSVELGAAGEIHIPATAAQLQQLHGARSNPAMRAGFYNGGSGEIRNIVPRAVSSSPTERAGTLSITHSNSPTRPAKPASTAVPNRDAAVTRQATRAPQAPARTAEEPKESASVPQSVKQPAQSSPPARSRIPPHAESRPP